jgi:transketolase
MQVPPLTPFGTRRAEYHEINSSSLPPCVSDSDIKLFESFDIIYRSLCAMMYNFAPLSGHPGGSISSGRFVTALLYNAMKYDISKPDRLDADIISYSAGHKALGLYAHWALRNEIIRIAAPELLPKDIKQQLRLEDLLGFRKNPITNTTLYKKFQSKPLDGHPTPATPFVKLSTGASGVGLASSVGLAFAAADVYGTDSPFVHIIEGEGGLTPGRVSETLAAAATASLKNVILHIDFNQASIDSNTVCREGHKPGDYVQWTPAELTYLNDWNTILVEDGKDFKQILAAQEKALRINNGQPTAIVYRTVKGWNYGIEGSKSHGGGHALCSAGFYTALSPLLDLTQKDINLCKDKQLCNGGSDSEMVEHCFWNALTIIREFLETHKEVTSGLADMIISARQRLNILNREIRNNPPDLSKLYAECSSYNTPKELLLAAGTSTTLRGQLGNVLRYYNKVSNGAILTASADLLGSTSVNTVGKDFADGYYNAKTNPLSRTLAVGGICEDAMAGIMTGISSFGNQIGVCSSYGAFIAALGHIAARLHAIGQQAKQSITESHYDPFFLICAHAGIKTGEDGPTHADPQPLQLVQENFPKGTAVTLTPWEPQEIWPLVTEALNKRPAIICPFVTRPNEKIIDRKANGLSSAFKSTKGVYLLRKSVKKIPDGIVVLQGSEVAYAFVEKTLPMLLNSSLDISAYYVSSAELFDMLPLYEQKEIFPEEVAMNAMGITGFTLPTMYRWIQSAYGREHTIYPFKKGHFLGSGKAESVVAEAGLDGFGQYKAILSYLKGLNKVAEPIKDKTLLNH